ncbi:MAG: hypothetical protein JOY61_13680, partial [Chloroflexi bacterium]|nr:hypothetical protein [Chloroflexota bacterium]
MTPDQHPIHTEEPDVDQRLDDARATAVREPSRSVLGHGNRAAPAQKKRSLPYRIGGALIGLLGVTVVLGLSGAVYESVAEAADARAYPPPGQMVDVGGYRLHINCI